MTDPQHHARAYGLRTAVYLRRACAVASVLTSISTIGCAATTPYNPDNLDTDRYARVSTICQNVMGLTPHDRTKSGVWMDPRLDYDTSYYRGCIVSLSDSLQNASDKALTHQADADCRVQGFKPDSAELALCVLRSVNRQPASTPASSSASQTPIAELVGSPAGSFYYASPGETVHREQVACAALGFSPVNDAFKACVQQLDNTFYAIDKPIDE